MKTASPGLSFRLDGSQVVQEAPSGSMTHDPDSWGRFLRGSLVVRACHVPVPFRVGVDVVRGGYLVVDDRGLFAMSVEGFRQQYRPLTDPKNPEDAEPGEWSTAA